MSDDTKKTTTVSLASIGGPGARELEKACDEIDSLRAEVEGLTEERDRYKDAVNIDRSGLAAGLVKVKTLASGWGWLGNDGEWGAYSWEEQTMQTLRDEMATCIEQVVDACSTTLRKSGDLATDVIRDGVDIRAVVKDRDALRAVVEEQADYAAHWIGHTGASGAILRNIEIALRAALEDK